MDEDVNAKLTGAWRAAVARLIEAGNRATCRLNERIKSEGARLSRGLSAKQIEILQVLASHWHGEGTVAQLASIYAVRPEDLCERPHQVLKRTKRALASLELRGLVTTHAGNDTAGHPRWSGLDGPEPARA